MEYLKYIDDEEIDEGDFSYPNKNNTYLGFTPQASQNNRDEDMSIIIAGILSNVENEENFYNILMLQAITKEDKMLLQRIVDDKHRHTVVLKDIYSNLTGRSRYANNLYSLDTPDTRYTSNLQDALLNKIGDVEKYQLLHSNASLIDYKGSLFNILVDEIRNVNLLNLLIYRNI